MPPRPDLSSPRMNLRLSNRRIFISDFKSLHISAHLSCPRMNSRVPLPRRPRFRPCPGPIRASRCRDDRPERAQPSLPRMNLAIRAARPCPGQITKKVMKLTGRPHITKHNCAQRKIVDAYFLTNSLRQGEISRPSAGHPLSDFPMLG